ncbi:hypothetical protein GGI43DRAFT_178421 [Trichoderma evansii]
MNSDPSRNHPPPTTSAWMPYPETWTSVSPVHMQSPEPLERGGLIAAMNSFANPPVPVSTAQSIRAPFRGHPASSAPSYGLNGVNGNQRFGAEPPRNMFDSFAPQPQPPVRVLIRNLSANTTEEALRLMLVFSNELISVELLAPTNSDDPRYRSALLYFQSMNGAIEAQTNLNGRVNMNNSGSMMVDVLAASTYSSPVRMTPNPGPLASPNAAPNVDPFMTAVARPQPSLGNGFPSHDAMSPTMRGRFFSSVPTHQDLAAPDTEASIHYKNLFNPQSPIGNHLANELPGRLGKYIINNELGDDDDSELLRDPIAYAENGTPAQRRATAPNIPTSQMSSLSINTSAPPLPSYIPTLTSPVHGINGSNGYMRGGQQQSQQNHHSLNQMPKPQQSRSQAQQHQQEKPEKQKPQQDRQQQPNQPVPYGRPNFPPVNPADQNPPCNTLYVGNLPVDTAEEELKAMFSKQRGYKRLCFRTKQNGPMCFVEFEDISFATKALNEMYGAMLHNSTKGGIRLSFSKNPLGVRSGQPPSQVSQTNVPPMNGVAPSNMSNGFAAASGPPPGLSAPPGLGSRGANYGGAGHNITNQRNIQLSSLQSNGNHHQHPQDTYFAYTSSNNGNGTVVSFSNSGSSRTTPFYTNGASRPAKPRTPFA